MVISFDIFDTLIYRRGIVARKVFRNVEDRLKLLGIDEDFYCKRREAERLARKELNKEEITFNDIYMFYDSDDKERLMNIEIEMELLCVKPYIPLKILYFIVKKTKNTIILTSDMYHSFSTMEALVQKCGYSGYKELLVSSEVGLTKKTGNIYDYIKKRFPNDKIIHIGDNLFCDVKMSRRKGIISYWVFFSFVRRKIFNILYGDK